jgi:CheY-like chemotaxis protein
MRSVERSRHIPIIFITAAAQEQHREFRGYLAHGGTIEVSSSEAAGTTFRIQLPREPPPAT